MSSALTLALAVLAASAQEPERVTFQTADELTIVADWYSAGEGAPTVICLPMYKSTRETWAPLAAPLLERGVSMLSLDLRGHGESAPELAGRAADRDPELFNAMHEDVSAAIAFLAQRGEDTTRLVLAGASVGCSVAIDVTRRRPSDVRGTVLLTPGAKYLGVDTLAHLAEWPGTPTLIVTSTEERAKVDAVAHAMLQAAPDATRYEMIEGEGLHGTRMFTIEGGSTNLAKFISDHLVRAHLLVPHFGAEDERVNTAGFVKQTLRTWRSVTRTDGSTERDRYTLMAFAVGDTLTLGAMTDQPFKGEVVIDLGEREMRFGWDTSAKDEIPVQVTGGSNLSASPASFRETFWASVELEIPKAMTKGPLALALTFVPEGAEKGVRLPAGAEPFSAHLNPR